MCVPQEKNDLLDDWVIVADPRSSTLAGNRLRPVSRCKARGGQDCSGGNVYSASEDGDWLVLDVNRRPTRLPQERPVTPLAGTPARRVSCSSGTTAGWTTRCGPAAQAPSAPSTASSEAVERKVNSEADGFLHIKPTWAVLGRSFTDRHPYVATIGIWALLSFITIGELAPTWWWFINLDAWDMSILTILAAGMMVPLLIVMTAGQVVAFLLSVAIVAAPSMPAYTLSGVLRAPPLARTFSTMTSNVEEATCSLDMDLVHWLALTAVAILHFSEASGELPHPFSATGISRWGIALLAISGGLYAVAGTIQVVAYMRSSDSAEEWCCHFGTPLRSELIANMAAFLAAKARRRIWDYFGLGLLPRLVGVYSPKRITPQEFAMRYGERLWELLPALEDCVPPPLAVAGVMTLQYVAVPALVARAVLMHTELLSVWTLLIWVPMAVAGLVCAAFQQLEKVPSAPLCRLLMLVPALQLNPAYRTAIGYTLQAAARIESLRGGIQKRLFGATSSAE
mmetsp:Transcript_38089/g.89206  ORF Transcript_38089/g.89206 Transcript_38089/m.89206 type:complete len:510 (+) Transcript_38089:76-1605(+)